MTPNSSDVYELAKRHANAWRAHDADAIAALYKEDSVFTINLGEPMTGRLDITDLVQGYCEWFPDLVLFSDKVRVAGARAIARSYGWFDAEEYERQCQEGYQAP